MRATTIFAAVVGLFSSAMAAPVPSSTNSTVGVARRFANSTEAAVALASVNSTNGDGYYDPHGGWCTMHVHIIDQSSGITAYIRVYDGLRVWVGGGAFHEFHPRAIEKGLGTSSGLPEDLQVWIGEKRPRDIAFFQYGNNPNDFFASGPPGNTNDHCSVGNWDHYETINTIDMDCGFTCTI